MKPTYISYSGKQPLAIIIWYTATGDIKCKTICYEELDVQLAYERHITPGNLYSKLVAKICMVGDMAIAQVS